MADAKKLKHEPRAPLTGKSKAFPFVLTDLDH